MSKTYDAIIIGAGIIGCPIAFELAKKGYKTLNVDKLAAAGSGSTSSSGAIVRAHYSTYDGVALAYENFSYWHNWQDYLQVKDPVGMARFMNTGTILIKSPAVDWRNVLRLYRQVGLAYEDWDAATLKEKMPIYATTAYYPPALPEDEDSPFWQDEGHPMLDGAVFTAESGYVNDPQLAAHNIQVAAEAKGAEFLFNEQVTAIRRAGGRVLGVTLADGQEIDAPVVVNAAGPHSFIINRMAGVEKTMNIKTRPLRREVHVVPAPHGFDFERNGRHTADGDVGVYFRPEVGNHILVGGEDPPSDPKIWIEDPDALERIVTNARWQAHVYRLARRIPDLPIPRRPKGVVDMYDVSDDWLALLDKSDLGGFYMAVGTSGHEFKNAPGIGYMMAQLIDACENGQDHDVDPVRYTTFYKGFELNIGFYSRRRSINEDSSFTVNG